MTDDLLLPDTRQRVEVYLPGEQVAWIKRPARQTRKPASQLLRELISAGQKAYQATRRKEAVHG
jgi:hypothetical protein